MEHRKKLIIAIVMPSYYEDIFGGSEYQASLLANAAINHGHEVHYIFAATHEHYNNPLNIKLHPIKRIKISKRMGSTWFIYYKLIFDILIEIKADVLYVRSGTSWAAITTSYAKQYGCKSIWHVASSNDITPKPFLSLIKRPFDLIERKAIEYTIKNATYVVAHARFQADLLLKHYDRNAIVILKEQPVPIEPIDKSGPFTILWVSNIKPLKQPEIFIRLADCLKTVKDLRFIMIGRPASGKYQDNLMMSIAQARNLNYLGEQPIEKVNQYFAQSHIFVNTSLFEGLPNTFVQAWMREVPIVSMLLDPDDILTKQNIGFFSRTFEQMVQDIQFLINNPATRQKMGERARSYALQNHSLDINMGKLIKLIES
jgi:glycosyltransferase involved in cell wall biosynthesis